jgi:hypothetical protein
VLDERADFQSSLDPMDVCHFGSGARVERNEELAAILIRLDRGGETAEPLRLFGNLDFIHPDERAEERKFRRILDHREILRRL